MKVYLSRARYSRASSKVISLWLLASAVFITCSLLVFPLVSSLAASSDFSKPFHSINPTELPAGSLVSLKQKNSKEIVLANSRLKNSTPIGVVVDGKDSLIAIDSKKGNVMVSISGQANALVTNLRGDIEAGDYIADSVVSGVGAKAELGDRIVGVALERFSIAGESFGKYITIDSSSGKKEKILIGSIPILVSPSIVSDSLQRKVGFLEKVAFQMAGKQVSTVRIILSGVIILVAIVSLLVMIFSSVKTSITAVSRNPLAKVTIFEALAQVMVMIVLVCLVGLTTAYLVIRV